MDKIFKRENKKLTISLNYDRNTEMLTVVDTSTGISKDTLEKAMDIGGDMIRPEGHKSLGEFNVGLKSSAIWLCDEWTINTKRHDEEYESTLVVDNQSVFRQ